MDKHYFIKLLHRYQNGDITNEERLFLESYYNLFRNEPDVFNRMSLEEINKLEKEIKECVWKDISKEEKTGAKIISINKRIVRVVAAAAVFIGIIGSLFFFYNRSKERQPVNYAIRQSSDKSKDDVKAVIALHQKENRVIFLPDGSTVFLSPGSRLNYPSTFDGMNKREVYLQGEGYFDIKHNATKPFIVHTGQVATTVLGTAFNIKALPDEKFITVTVNRGRVRVSDPHKTMGIITSRERISYNTEKQTSALTKVTNDSYLDWKNRDLFIDNLTLTEAAKLLEEQYRIRIIIKDSSIREQRFTATFPKNETLEEAVKSISGFNGLSYSIDRGKSIVTINNSK